MGARLAAHFANASVPCLLLNLVPKDLAREEQAQGVGAECTASSQS